MHSSEANPRGQNFFNPWKANLIFLISNFRLVLVVVCFLLGNSPVSEFYMPTFRNTLCSIFMEGRYEEWLSLRNVGLFIREKLGSVRLEPNLFPYK
jgi:hypothetical protein